MGSFYYNFDKLFSYNALLNFVITERGLGKTFGVKVAMLQKFIKNGDQFIYVRRYKTELDSALVTFWSDIQNNGYFDDLDLKVKKSKMLTKFTCDDEVCGFAVPLSTANILKSTAFPKVKYIVFDEFLIDDSGVYKYLKNEVQLMLDLIETTFRLRDGQVIFLGNALSITNPYFAYFDLELPYNSEFKSFKDGQIIVNYARNEEYRKVKKASRFGRLIEGTSYGRYAIDNQMLKDNHNFIEKRPPDSRFFGLVIINGMNVGIWFSRNGHLYMSEKFEPNTINKFACDYDDHTEDTMFVNARENYYLNACLKYYKQGLLRFENQKVKNVCIKLLNKCII
ncbi:MAG: phage DNA encapsidation protein [Erysipelotrichaceae bacterium]|nr:phage DNA encapsidation protein [Erysipelotrichaceae bacterium]